MSFHKSGVRRFDRWRNAANAISVTGKGPVSATTGFVDHVRFGDPRLILAGMTRAF